MVLGLIRQMGVAGGREDRVMAEILLDFDEVNTGLDQVRGIAVPIMPSSALSALCRVPDYADQGVV